MMPMAGNAVPACVLVIAAMLAAAPALSQVQATPEAVLRRAFIAGEVYRYRVSLTVRSESQGKRPVSIGAETYVSDFSRAAECRVSWRSTRRTLAIREDASGIMAEELDAFAPVECSLNTTDGEGAEARELLAQALETWSKNRTLSYREATNGQLAGARAEFAPNLGEAAPAVLSLWLMRALRPTSTLPAKPLEIGQSWSEPRAAEIPPWRDVQGSERVEWLEAPPGPEPAVRLHVVQQISGTVPDTLEAAERPPAKGQFLADSLSLLSLKDARLLAATRSASRETVWTIESVPGLTEPQRFRARLAVQIEIADCQNDACLTPSQNSR